MQISFVLVEPKYPENIGSAARALNTMGFGDLRLVKPVDHLCDNAKWLAHGSVHILENAKVFSDFESAVADSDIVIGTSAKKRKTTYNYFNASELKVFLTEKQNPKLKVSVVFGNEDKGLPNDVLKRCQIVSFVPLANRQPSLNLAQTVMIYSYLLSGIPSVNSKRILENHSLDLAEIRSRINALMLKAGENSESNFSVRLNERLSDMSDSDIKMIYYIIKKFEKMFDK